jgi:hypothetical protein
MLVARLVAKNVYADIPEAEEANAHRSASSTQDVNSARQNMVSCERMFRTKILRSGRWNMSADDRGSSKELLYAKKQVNEMLKVVIQAHANVNRWFQTGDGKSVRR